MLRERWRLMDTGFSTKSLGTFFGFRGHLITTADGVPVDFAIASADRDDREVLPVLSQGVGYRIVLGDKGYVSQSLQRELLETENTCVSDTPKQSEAAISRGL